MSSARALRTELGWLKLEDKRSIHYNSLIWSAKNGLSPLYVKDMLTETSAIHGYNTRNRLYVPSQRRYLASKSFTCQAPILFNKLPDDTRNAISLAAFRTGMFDYIKRVEQHEFLF